VETPTRDLPIASYTVLEQRYPADNVVNTAVEPSLLGNLSTSKNRATAKETIRGRLSG
jgi:hypothetical protein